MNRIRIFFILTFCSITTFFAQQKDRTKLVVGIVVDQMRAEYLYRFQDNYSENGFKRLMREGFHVKNMHYNYIPTTTGPGHASIFTGATPSGHGIVANDWYSHPKKRAIYCAEDETVFLIDSDKNSSSAVSKYSRSPKNLQSSTITDELKLFSNGRSKVIGISLKDRASIFPSGHLADYAFWYNTDTGNFITSSYYTNSLPKWVQEFNGKHIADSLLNLTWDTLKPIEEYKNSGPDDVSMEKIFKGKKDATFPYNFKKLRKKNGNFALLTQIPFGNSLLTQLAKTTISSEKMGKDDDTDFLTLSYSSTDYVGHNFGIRSKEIEDTYVRMDNEIAELLTFLDGEVGKDNYLLFLTADHAASDHPEFLKKSRLPGKFFNLDKIRNILNEELGRLFGDANYVTYLDQTQIYLSESSQPREHILKQANIILKSIDDIMEVYVPSLHNSRHLNIDSFFRKNYNSENSGDIILQFKTGRMVRRTEGTSHGSPYNDDTHVPMLWYGSNITHGETNAYHSINQIVPTLSMLLNIPLPNSAAKHPILEVLEN